MNCKPWGGGVVSNSVLVPCSEDGQVLKKATVENINAVTPTKPLKLYAHDGTYGFIDSPYFSDSGDQQIRFFTNNGRGIYLSNLNDDKPQYWDGTNGYPMVYLKESWVSGASWYRLYSDNWLEQGGQVNQPASAWTTVAFYKSFADINYRVILSQQFGDTTYFRNASVGAACVNSTFMTISCYGQAGQINWYAYGYAA